MDRDFLWGPGAAAGLGAAEPRVLQPQGALRRVAMIAMEQMVAAQLERCWSAGAQKPDVRVGQGAVLMELQALQRLARVLPEVRVSQEPEPRSEPVLQLQVRALPAARAQLALQLRARAVSAQLERQPEPLAQLVFSARLLLQHPSLLFQPWLLLRRRPLLELALELQRELSQRHRPESSLSASSSR